MEAGWLAGWPSARDLPDSRSLGPAGLHWPASAGCADASIKVRRGGTRKGLPHGALGGVGACWIAHDLSTSRRTLRAWQSTCTAARPPRRTAGASARSSSGGATASGAAGSGCSDSPTARRQPSRDRSARHIAPRERSVATLPRRPPYPRARLPQTETRSSSLAKMNSR